MVYDHQFTSVLNSISDGLFADNPSNAYSWEKFFSSGNQRRINQENFDPYNQHHHMPELRVDWLTPDEGCSPLPSVTASEGYQPNVNREYIPSEGYKIPIPSAPGSDSIHQTNDNI